ncbi:MAG: glycosyltransferase family 4 protein [Holophagales bacterium]|nr:glycosyltransferase family 4 protein [Holophagales bacterium]
MLPSGRCGTGKTMADLSAFRHVAFDARPLLEPRGGLRRYLGELLPALAAEAPHVAWTGITIATPPDAPPDRVSWSVVPGPRASILRPFWEALPLRRALESLGPDVFFSPWGAVPGGSPVPVVATLHDVSFLALPRTLPLRHRLYWSRLARRLPLAAAVIAVSEATRTAALARLPLDPSRVHVVPEAAGSAFRPAGKDRVEEARKRHSLPERFVLAVGAFEPRKNLGTAVAATGLVARRLGAPLPLVVVGREAPGPIEGAPHARRLGPLGDDELAALMTSATAVVVPSLDEGFGLPLLEAMSCGAPVVASNAGALPEVAGGAALLVDPLDDAGWVDALARIVEDDALAARLRSGGLARAEAFSWRATARATLALLATVAEARR